MRATSPQLCVVLPFDLRVPRQVAERSSRVCDSVWLLRCMFGHHLTTVRVQAATEVELTDMARQLVRPPRLHCVTAAAGGSLFMRMCLICGVGDLAGT